jgi:hypothetical protein
VRTSAPRLIKSLQSPKAHFSENASKRSWAEANTGVFPTPRQIVVPVIACPIRAGSVPGNRSVRVVLRRSDVVEPSAGGVNLIIVFIFTLIRAELLTLFEEGLVPTPRAEA